MDEIDYSELLKDGNFLDGLPTKMIQELSRITVSAQINDRKNFFNVTMNSALAFARLRWANGQQVNSTITGFSESGESYIYTLSGEREIDNPLYYRIYQEFYRHDVIVAMHFCEAWGVERTMETKSDEDYDEEVVEYMRNGGRLQFWPDSFELFHIEMFDGENIDTRNYNILRDENGQYESYELRDMGTRPFQPYAGLEEKVNSPLIYLMRKLREKRGNNA